MIKNSSSAISLFSGAGGMDVGFEAAGFDVVLANDIDKDACATYELNHSGALLHDSLLNHLETLSRFKWTDLVFGGPPCQGFSVAGKMDPNDERSKLLLKFFDVVDLIRPKAFVCENVKALGQLDRWSTVRSELHSRAKNNYNFAMVVLSADDFGVPQRRERVFGIGISKELGDLHSRDFKSILLMLLDGQKKPADTVGDVIKRIGRAGSAGNKDTCNANITFAKAPVLRKSPYAGMLFNGAGRPLATNGYASTLPASMGGNKTPIVDEGEIFDNRSSFVEEYHQTLLGGRKPRTGYAPKRLRRLTVAECLEFQTFPAGYRLSGRQSAKYRQIGNAVPCKLAEAVANVTRELMQQDNLLEYVKHVNGIQEAAE